MFLPANNPNGIIFLLNKVRIPIVKIDIGIMILFFLIPTKHGFNDISVS